MSALPANVERATRLVALWVRDLTDDWVVIKEQILDEVNNETRTMFTRRDERTKEITSLNPMEAEIVTLWKQLTGVELKLYPFKARRELRWWRPAVEFEDDDDE